MRRSSHVFFEQEFDPIRAFPVAPARPAQTLTAGQLESLWGDLGQTDTARSYLAMWVLAAVPQQSVAFLKELLRPVAAPDAGQQQRIAIDLRRPAELAHPDDERRVEQAACLQVIHQRRP